MHKDGFSSQIYSSYMPFCSLVRITLYWKVPRTMLDVSALSVNHDWRTLVACPKLSASLGLCTRLSTL